MRWLRGRINRMSHSKDMKESFHDAAMKSIKPGGKGLNGDGR